MKEQDVGSTESFCIGLIMLKLVSFILTNHNENGSERKDKYLLDRICDSQAFLVSESFYALKN